MEQEVTVNPIVVGVLGTFLKGLEKKTEGILDQKKDEDYKDFNIKIGFNIQKHTIVAQNTTLSIIDVFYFS